MEKIFENLAITKNGLCTAIGVIGSMLYGALGGYSPALGFLIGVMCVDYILGIVIAALKLSPKTETGGLNSSIGFRGLMKKVGILIFVWIGYQIDVVFEINIARNAIIIGYLANEVISITENLGILGVIKIDAVTNAIDILKSKSNQEV